MMTWEELVELLGPISQQVPIPHARYNIAPSSQILVTKSESSQKTLTTMPWGVKPEWSKRLIINAQAEKYTGQGHSFWKSWQRCLIPTSGFYEWKVTHAGKEPTFIRLKEEKHFAIGGLYRGFEYGGVMVDMTVILTTKPNELMTDIHHRMPVIVARQDHQKWLSRSSSSHEIGPCVAPFPAEKMEAWAVGHLVDNARNDRPECMTPANSEITRDD